MQKNERRREEGLQEGRGSQGKGCQGRCQGNEESVIAARCRKIRGASRPLIFCAFPGGIALLYSPPASRYCRMRTLLDVGEASGVSGGDMEQEKLCQRVPRRSY